ncbi:hypothetical protein ACEPAI_4402 [Sanghuangporus weigelae]
MHSKAKTPDGTTRIPFDLNSGERWWRDRYSFLMKYGYQLRPRFRPGWTPTWVRKKKDPLLCEDGYRNFHPKVIDAVRVSDGTKVAIKRVPRRSDELPILKYLTSEEMLRDPRNHAVPLLDVFSEDDDAYIFIVMPLLINFSILPFTSVDEVVHFMRQMLEGLSFLHDNNVAHRDCSTLNIMMDGTPVFPRGFHPGARNLEYGRTSFAHPRRRRDVAGVKYYFTDFGISSHFDGNDANRLVTGKACLDKNLPELYQDDPHDPFAVDIFLLGDVFKDVLVEQYDGLSFLAPLIDAMIQRDPKSRPTVRESLQLFNDIVKQQTPRLLLRLIVTSDADRLSRFLCDIGSMKRETKLAIKSWLSSLRKAYT